MEQPKNDWNGVINADLKDAEFSGGLVIPDGQYEAMLSSVEAVTFKAGSKGLKVTYAITLNGKVVTINDYFVIKLADGSSNPTGSASVKKLILECGTDVEKLATFKFPAFDSKALGDFKFILEAPLSITIKAQTQKSGLHAGKSFPRVKSFSGIKKAA